jgi:hypothetical protein
MIGWTEDARAYEALQPFQVAAYLRSRGWQRSEDIRDVATVWVPSASDQQVEVILPTDRTVGDFAIRMAELIRALSAIEHRPPDEITSDIIVATSDVVRLSFVGEAYDDGTVPIETGARLVGLVRDAVLAAASVTAVPRAVLPTRKPELAVEFLRKVRLGQTERGSYVLTVQSPVQPDLVYQPELMPDAEGPRVPYERRVMLTLAHALEATRHAATDAAATGSSQSFVEAVKSGVSANLCDAIAGMLDAPETHGITVSFSWSPTRPEKTSAPSFVSFDKGAATVIGEASRIFRARAPQTDIEIEGEVIRLERPVGFRGGEVAVAALVEGKPHVVQIELDAPDYLDAIDAHRGEVRVRCRGELIRRGGRYILLNPKDFEVE